MDSRTYCTHDGEIQSFIGREIKTELGVADFRFAHHYSQLILLVFTFLEQKYMIRS